MLGADVTDAFHCIICCTRGTSLVDPSRTIRSSCLCGCCCCRCKDELLLDELDEEEDVANGAPVAPAPAPDHRRLPASYSPLSAPTRQLSKARSLLHDRAFVDLLVQLRQQSLEDAFHPHFFSNSRVARRRRHTNAMRPGHRQLAHGVKALRVRPIYFIAIRISLARTNCRWSVSRVRTSCDAVSRGVVAVCTWRIRRLSNVTVDPARAGTRTRVRT